ncbi:hypothetical protein [Nocardia niwae]|uniref:Uncharacterized protein n=1 Tax=Nocardia niwae TaxID=626084 RepID=A0ABV2X8W1_9NOCA|nr:hypothetical protein [Nocardia niwae]
MNAQAQFEQSVASTAGAVAELTRGTGAAPLPPRIRPVALT